MDKARRRAWAALDLGPVWRREGPAQGVDASGALAGVPSASNAAPRHAASDTAGLDWPALREAVAACQQCALCDARTQTVFGVGAQNARWMFVGEAPGAEEDLRGEPFVGQAGKLLDAMLAALGLDRQRDVFIVNVLKCRPPDNRNPEPDEVRRCAPFLQRQIELVRPRVIVAMGRFAAQSLLGTEDAIGTLRGRVHALAVEGASTPLVATYHPADLLRNLADKSKVWADLCLARGLMDTPVEPRRVE